MASASKTERYRLEQGKHSGFDEDGNEKTFGPGDWLILTETQAKAFGNKIKSEKVLKAEAAAFNALNFDEKTDASPAMTPTRDQPLAPTAPVEEGTNQLESEADQEALVKQTALNTGQETENSTPATAAKVSTPAVVKPAK